MVAFSCFLLGLGGAALDGRILPSTFRTARPVLAVLYAFGILRCWDLKTEAGLTTINLAAGSLGSGVAFSNAKADRSGASGAESEPLVIKLAFCPTQVDSILESSSGDIIAVAGGHGSVILLPVTQRHLHEGVALVSLLFQALGPVGMIIYGALI
ncbi:unnamed protein product [Protopolystoma xenopodis]|uniref:Uncharacterized protein n=1 Tax=Protopolystoma xenopodis TaxID=117903 RepID=A0A3S5BPT6_9PLAT|nr:unnamed protein product [Protopolystoma xenopodis]